MMAPLRIGLCLFVVCGIAIPAQGEGESTSPERLLPKALELARTLPDGKGYGNWAKPLAVLRIASTMRLAGMNDEALAAFEECTVMNSRLSEEATRDEIGIELCRAFTLVGKTNRARELAKELKFRNYSTVALYVTARTALEMNRPAEAEQVIRNAVLNRSSQAKTNRGDDLWTRACVRLAVGMNDVELAGEIANTLRFEPWKSAAAGDVAEALARQGKSDEAVSTAAEIPDAYMAVLACARLAIVFSEKNAAEPLAQALDALDKAAAKISDDIARDFALRIAAEKLAAAGRDSDALKIAGEIKDPCVRTLASCATVTPDNLKGILDQLERCPAKEQPLVAEAITAHCGSKGLISAALDVSAKLDDGWPRCRALCESARRLAERDAGPEAAKLLDAAAQSANQIADPGWKCCAFARLALGYHLVAHDDGVDESLATAEKELSRLTEPEVIRSLLPQVVEAAVASERREFANRLIRETLAQEADATLRSRLVPMLVSAGYSDDALAECSQKAVSDSFYRRLMAYRLGIAGDVAAAVKYAEKLRVSERAEALSDIALAQIQRPTPQPCARKVVGVSLHGSWGSWFPRLERLGIAWELMPFSAPYEEGADGLRARYSMLAYPGTGGHALHVAVAGAENLREYLHSGGGFFGICAGQFLATTRQFVACDTVYMRGHGPHQIQMRKDHPIVLGLPPVVVIPRRNGGMLIPRPGCEVAGWYDTIERYAALVAGGYGLGRVVAFSPHPEGSSGFIPRDRLCINATYWANGGSP